MNAFSKTRKLFVGLGVVSSAAAVWYGSDKNKAYASWTTNYQPPTFAKWDDNWDHRAPDVLEKPNGKGDGDKQKKSKACRNILLIRHGQYNTDGSSDEEQTLTKLGRIQAEYTGKRLAELNFPYTEIFISTMKRARETGTIISSFLRDVPVQHCDFLREGAPVPPEPPIGSWRPEKSKFFQDGSRIEAAFRKYFYRASPDQENDSFTILVCHANVIRYFVCRALQFPAEGWLRISLNHASITWITVTPSGRCVLRQLGDCGHMPPEVITSR